MTRFERGRARFCVARSSCTVAPKMHRLHRAILLLFSATTFSCTEPEPVEDRGIEVLVPHDEAHRPITVARDEHPWRSAGRLAPPFILEPSGSKFSTPLEATIALSEPVDEAIALLCDHGGADRRCERVPSELFRDTSVDPPQLKLRAEVGHFSVLMAETLPDTNTSHSVVGDEGWNPAEPLQLSLTYDDGPDNHSLELAKYLHSQGIQATFFVNGRRMQVPYQSYCQRDADTFTSAAAWTYLQQLLDLGHRIANHTTSHCPWWPGSSTDPALYAGEVQGTQTILDGHLRDGARLLRHPYGANGRCRQGELSRFDDNLLSHIAWDGEWLDWDCPGRGSPDDCANSYLALTNALANDQATFNFFGATYNTSPMPNNVRQKNRMIVLMHDRLEFSPRTTYARDMAQALIPKLRARANTQIVSLEDASAEVAALIEPQVGFGPRRARGSNFLAGASSIDIADMDNDGDGDVCFRLSDGIYCAWSDGADFEPRQRIYAADFRDADTTTGHTSLGWQPAAYGGTIRYPDVDGDGRLDLCGRGRDGIRCVLQPANGWLNGTTPNAVAPSALVTTSYSNTDDGGQYAGNDAWYTTIRFADVNGDGKLDLCSRGSVGIRCNLARGKDLAGMPSFGPVEVWSDGFTTWGMVGWSASLYGSTVQFADVNGDSFADICGRGGAGVTCFVSNGSNAFLGGASSMLAADFSDAAGWDVEPHFRSVRAADVNGDGRADICGLRADGVRCSLSTGTTFAASAVLATGFVPDADSATLIFGDLNRSFDAQGDLLLDVCMRTGGDDLDCATNKLPARPLLYPESCRDAKLLTATPADGAYTLYHRRDKQRPWTAHCAAMNTDHPREYLTLINTGGNNNFSQYYAGGYSPGSNVRTSYSRVRINPRTFVVDIGDQSFASSTGSLMHGSEWVTSMPFGVAADCYGGTARGTANVDLGGTPFRLNSSAFVTSGYYPTGGSGATHNAAETRVDIAGGGTCGWTSPRGPLANPFNARGGFILKLNYVAPAPVAPATPASCAQVRAANSSAGDGTYTLYYQNNAARPWRAHCRNMSTTPLDYLILPRTTGRSNYSQFTAQGTNAAANVRTYYSRVKIDPLTLVINTADRTYAMTAYEPCGSASNAPYYLSTQVTSMPYAAAMDCRGAGSTQGVANIDLRATPFTVAGSALTTSGSGAVTISAGGQIAAITGGGACGWTSAGGTNPVTGSGSLSLTYP